jgi:serine/threonine protein phosphatase 1
MASRFCIGDIHGCDKTFAALLNQLGLQKIDTLYLIGDYIDRGKNSKGVLDRILALIAAGYDLRPLRGNHEQLLLDAVEDPLFVNIWYGNGGLGTLREFGVSQPSEIPRLYLDFLDSLPFKYLTDDFVLVHAGLDFRKSDPVTESSSFSVLWARDYRVDPDKLAGRTLVTGHTVEPLFEIRKSLETQHIKLDNGCFDKYEIGCGSLVAVKLDTRELIVQTNIE